MSKTAHAAFRANHRRPCFSIVAGLVHMRSHVAKGVPVKRGISGGRVVETGFDPGHPGKFGKIGYVGDDIAPGFSAVARQLKVAVVRAYPNDLPLARRFADRINRRVRLGVGIINGDAAGFFLLLFFGIVGREVRRNAIPSLAMVARTEEELRTDIDGAFFVRAHVNGSVPVEAQLAFSVIWLRLDGTAIQRDAINAANISALRFGVDIVGVRRITKNPEAVATEK